MQEDVINHFDSKFYSKIDAKHFKVNLQKWALNQILDSNIKVENVFISKNCTIVINLNIIHIEEMLEMQEGCMQ